ncbi:MAG TPA: POTRA domain-containing protein, partial [Vicinamibacterales bacterium]|nr:POTRA domain-containing protein [Vicinamibacterales bacterium]
MALVSASPAHADVLDYVGQPVASVRLIVDGRDTTDPALTRLVELRVGEPFSMRGVRETVLHLYAMGRFDDVSVDASRQPPGGVDVKFEMTSTKPVSAIEFAGNVRAPGVDVGALRKAVTERAGPSPPLTRLDELSGIVEAALRTRGYLHSKVTARVVPNGRHTTLVFDLDPGMRATIGTITVDGPDAARAEFLAKLQATAGAPYERDVLNERIAKYVADRRSQGYYEAKASLVDEAAGGERYNLTFTIDPGRHVKVVFTGDPLPGDRKELVPIEREGSIDEDFLEDATARIEDALRARGYKDAMAPHTRAEADGELVITFNVSRGQQYRIAGVTITGNTSVPSTDLKLPPRLREGEPFSQAVVDAEAGAIEDVYRRAGFGAAKADVDVKLEPA